MRAALLDRRVRREAKLLVRDARNVLALPRKLKGKREQLEATTSAVESALAASDLARVRKHLAALDLLVDRLVHHKRKSSLVDSIKSIGTAVLIALALRAFIVEAFKIPSSSMYPTLEIGDHIFVNKFLYGMRIPFTNTKLFQIREPHRGEVIVFVYPCDPERDYIKRVVATAGDSVEVRCNVVHVNGAPVPSEVVTPAYAYIDLDERAVPPRWVIRACSRYRETVDDFTYETFHDSNRPWRDLRIATHSLAHGDMQDLNEHDFPRIGDPTTPSCTRPEAGATPHRQEQTLGEIVVDRSPMDGTVKACDLQAHYVVPPGHVFVMGDNRSNSNDSRVWGSVPIENIKGKAMFIWWSYAYWGLDQWDGIRWDRLGNFVH
jgi:signal peptidase I